MGRAEEGIADLDEALDLERTLNQTEGEAQCLLVRSHALAALGRSDEALRDGELALEMTRRLGHRQSMVGSLLSVSRAHQSAGAVDKAEAVCREALSIAEENSWDSSLAAGRLASLLMERGDPEAARPYAEHCLAHGTPVVQYDGLLVSAEVALTRGHPGGRKIAADALARAEAGGYTGTRAYQRLRALVPRESARQRRSRAPKRERERRTFMFTDIVRSTNLVEALGDGAWEHLLRWHDEMLRSVVASHGGEEINRIGDGFFVAFEKPEAAVSCAVAIQQALVRHRRENGFAPEVRLGLHEAEATRQGDDYQGRGVHVAARIGAMAAGGEILASRALLSGIQNLALSDPRSVALRGLSEPLEVVSIAWE